MKLQVTGERPVDAIDVTGGQQPTVIDVTAGTVTSVNGRTGAVTIGSSDVGAPDWINAFQKAAVGDGIHDDTAALQAAINACQPGGIVYLPRGVYKTTATLDLKNGVTLLGSHNNLMLGPGMSGSEYPCYIQPQGPFTGSSVIQIIGDDDGIHPALSGEQRILNLMIDGSQLSGTAVDGLYAKGNVQNVVLEGLTIRQMPNNGIVTAPRSSDGQYPYSWRMRHVMVDGCHAHGILFTLMTDLTAIDCQVIGSWANGWVLTNLPNSQLTNCRAEWCGNYGFLITGSWGSGTGSGGASLTGCSTDRNGWDGIHVDATGNGPIQITGLTTRRDGRNGGAGGGGYAGLAANGATVPLIIGDWTNYPGVDDNSSGTSSPQYGAAFTNNTFVQVDNAYLHAATAGLNNGGGNIVLQCRNVTYAAGPTSSPVRTTPQTSALGWASVTDPAFGAKGDGVTDATAAIQAAVTSLGSRGGTVYLPPGDFLLNGASPINLSAPVTLQGAGHGATSIRIGSGFTGSSAIMVSSDDCMIQGLQIRGDSSTVTSNPACHGVTATGVQETRVFNSTFQYINGYALRLLGTAATTLHGTQINTIKIQSCAGAIHIKSDPAATAANVQLSNIFTRFLGVASGANANLDGLRIEDSWDVLAQNVMPWMNATTGGTGAAFRVTGNCAAIFVQNLDALGPQTGTANVVIESGTNGDPQNVQIQGGVIQQGIIGLLIAGASNQVRVRNVRILNNQTHNVSVTSSGYGIYLDECLISQGGAGATGTNYDINWTGSAEGFITDCRFGSSVVTTGTAGVQGIINIATAVVRVLNANFTGTGSSSANWYPTTTPQIATRVDGTNYEMRGNVDVQMASGQRWSLRPSSRSSNTLAINVGSGTNDDFRLLGDGTQQHGAGGASARDTTWGRQGAAQIGTPDSDVVIGLAGKTLRVKEGTNAKAGTVTLNGTTAVTVTTTAVTSTSRIYLGFVTPAGTPGAPYMSAKTVGTSFQVKSVAGDTSLIAWWIIEAA